MSALSSSHHPHVIQPVERYENGIIAYSLGNFIFDQEGYILKAGIDTEIGLVIRIRLHKTLGLSFVTRRSRIVDRYQVIWEE